MSSSANMTADDYIDYLYDDAEDFASNVDYTAPESYAYLDAKLPKLPPLARKALSRSASVLRELETYMKELIYFQEEDFFSFIMQAFMATSIVVIIGMAISKFPGHSRGSYWPIYIPEHYGKKNSQNLLDPYSVVHFGHGILSYYMLHFLDGEEEPFFIFRKNRFNMKERIMKPIKSGLGLITTLFLALAFEVAENSPIVIAFFRKNSGTSEEYRGDSAVNVIGDLLSCSLGYNLARYMSLSGFYTVPLVIYVISEMFLALTIRDNLFLMALQLVYPIKWIKEWQAEIIPKEFKTFRKGKGYYWSSKYEPKFTKYL